LLLHQHRQNGLTENAGRENAGHENDGPISRAWNCKTWKISWQGMNTMKDWAIVARFESGYRGAMV